MFNNKGLKWIYRIIMILPIIPIIWNIIYINQYSGFDSLLRLNLSLIFIFLYLAILMFGLYVVKEENKVGTIILTIVALIGLFTGTYFGYVNTHYRACSHYRHIMIVKPTSPCSLPAVIPLLRRTLV